MTKTWETSAQDLNWALGLNRISLRFMGVWPDDEDFEKKFLKNSLRIPLMVSSMFFFVFLPQMYALTLVKNDLGLVLDNLMTSCPAFTSCLKLLFLWQNKEVLRPVINSITSDWLRLRKTWEQKIMKNAALFAKFFTIGGYLFIGGSYVGFVVVPIFGLNIRLLSNITDYGKHHLLVQSYYPYDYSKSPNFELTHLSQFIGGLMIAISLAVPDNYFGAIIFHVSAQYEILGIHIEKFIRREGFLEHSKNEHFNKYLGLYVDRHVHLTKMILAVEKSFTLLILAQLFCMSVMTCCLGVRILYTLRYTEEKSSIIQLMNLGAALVALMLFTLADCSASEALNFHSTGLFNCISRSTWYVLPPENSRCFILMMLASKSPQLLTAGKICHLSLSSYASILKSILGYLSMLIAVSNQEPTNGKS